MKSEKARIFILCISIGLFVGNLLLLDYQQLFSRPNAGPALGLLANIFLGIAMILSLRHTQKKEQEE